MSTERPPVTDREVRTEDTQRAAELLAYVDGVTKVPPELYDQALYQLADFIAAARYYVRGGF